jgi:heptosyltransferase I
MNILVVRLGALGDVVHTIPAVAAIRAALPDARIDWLVESKHGAIVELVTVVDRIVRLEGRTIAGWGDAIRRLRETPYEIALDFQGLMKSAVFARASGARRVAGFSIWHLREKGARPFYSETDESRAPAGDAAGDGEAGHVIQKNLHLLGVLGIQSTRVEFPLVHQGSRALDEIQSSGRGPFALINPGAAWPNKRWPPERFGEIAAFMREIRGLSSIVLWGPGEQPLAQAVVDASGGAARLAPATEIADLVELARAAALIVSGDTGPLHIAAAVGTPAVALYGPTDPARNGPWDPDDVNVSRFDGCDCHYERRCRRQDWCIASITSAEVTAAIQQRLTSSKHSGRLPSPELRPAGGGQPNDIRDA